jgi:ribonucleoside-diphosphate reductase alpha chain
VSYTPTGFALEIFKKRYALHAEESFEEANDRVARHLAAAEKGEKIEAVRREIDERLNQGQFSFGGRIMFGSGRPRGQLLNCFVVPTSDSREGWGKTTSDHLIISGTGGGVGANYSSVRPRGTPIQGTGGIATGAVSLMRIVNAVGEEIKAGGGRRTALMQCLNIGHGDIDEFLSAKLDLSQLNNANVSVNFDTDPEKFFEHVREIGSHEHDIWRKIIVNALRGGEPGVLNGYYANRMSNTWNIAPLESTNPCFDKGTFIHTREGHFPIETLVGKTVEIWNGTDWQAIDNFRITNRNQPMLKITLQDGTEERVTEYHTVILEDGTRLSAKNVKPGMKLAISSAPLSHGSHSEPAAYLKGFLIADGSTIEDRPLLCLYPPKYMCKDRLIESTCEMAVGNKYTNAKELGFVPARKHNVMTGLAPYKHELFDWCRKFKTRLPVEVFAWDLRSKAEFIAGVMDGDGTALDSSQSYGYQVSSIQREWLLDFQRLLKTVGVRSKLSLMKKEGMRDFGDGYGPYKAQTCWRLVIPQSSAIVLSNCCDFARLKSFAHRQTAYSKKPRWNTVVSVEADGIAPEVYCCTVEDSHSLTLSSGNHWGQCGEQWLGAYDCCCLGAIVLPRFVVSGPRIDFDELEDTVRVAVRALDNTLTVNNYPLPEVKEMCSNIRRIGLGVMGLHDMLLMMGLRYNSDSGLELVDKVMKCIKNAAYEASIALAEEKGSFPRFDADKYLKSGFIRTLKPSLRSDIRKRGIRNAALLTIAPTGTTSMVQEVTGGIEPMFAPAYRRKYRDGEALAEETVVHPLFRKFIDEAET